MILLRKTPQPAPAGRDAAGLDVPPNPRVVWLIALVLLVTTFLAFVPALGNQFLIWDDDLNFLTNQQFRGLAWDNLLWMFGSFHAGHYQPMSWLTLGWDFEWGARVFGEHSVHGRGMDPRAYHLTNNLLHGVNAVLVYLLALRLLGWAMHRDPGVRTWAIHLAAAAAAAFFGWHPLRVENVAWITERRDLVSTMLLLATVLAYLRAARPGQAHRVRWLAITTFIYIASLMAKVSGAPLPMVLLALDWYPLRRWGSRSALVRAVVEKLPLLACAMAFSFIATSGQASAGWMYPLSHHPMSARIMQMFYGLCFYAWKTFAPFDLLPLYELHIPMNASEPRFVVSLMVVLFGAVAMLVLWWKKRAPALIVTAICYGAFLGPVLGLFQNGPQLVADRYSYVPGIGISILASGGVAWWLTGASLGRAARAGVVVLVCLILLWLAGQTWRQCKVWRTTETLWTYTLAKDPASAIANNGLGVLTHRDRGEPAQAIPYFRRAVEIDPYAKGFRSNLRNALRDAGQSQELVQAWIDEARFGEHDAQFHYEAGTAELEAKNDAMAVEHYTVSLALNEAQPQTHNNIAAVYVRLGRLDDAQRHYRRAIELEPSQIFARHGLAMVLARQGKRREALDALDALATIAPGYTGAAALRAELTQPTKPD